MIIYQATLDVPDQTLTTLTGWINVHRWLHDSHPWQRAASARDQALLVLLWFKESTKVATLAWTIGISIATAYRYLHEGIDVLAEHAPDLHEVIKNAQEEGWSHVSLDGTLIPTDRCRTPSPNGHDRWYSGKHHHHGGNIQVLSGPTGYPEWASPVQPGSVHDVTCARLHVFPALYPAAARGLPTLTDKGYEGAGIGILHPIKGRDLDPDSRCFNQLLTRTRALAERANALLSETWTALKHVTLDPNRIGQITAAALVLLHLQRPTKVW